MKTAPFNLEAALAGKSIVTRNGKPITDFGTTKNSSINANAYPYEGKISGETSEDYFTDEGQYSAKDVISEYDLFMLVEEDAQPEKSEPFKDWCPICQHDMAFNDNKCLGCGNEFESYSHPSKGNINESNKTPRLDLGDLAETVEKVKAALKGSMDNIDFARVTERIQELRKLYLTTRRDPELRNAVKKEILKLLNQ